uniref:Uncharacterized protein n=1 Tax=Romanomermis culicivorax TaxID=13658 RepID=A0A915KHV5_ROMCU
MTNCGLSANLNRSLSTPYGSGLGLDFSQGLGMGLSTDDLIFNVIMLKYGRHYTQEPYTAVGVGSAIDALLATLDRGCGPGLSGDSSRH